MTNVQLMEELMAALSGTGNVRGNAAKLLRLLESHETHSRTMLALTRLAELNPVEKFVFDIGSSGLRFR